MDYEKKYKEALELARDYYKANLKLDKVDEDLILEDIFPELKESEDERIRKAIVATIHLYYGEPLEDEAKEMIAWLEKQGEQILANSAKTCKDEQQPTDNDMKELLHTEYEKGRADAIVEMQNPSWSEEDEEFLRRAINATKDAYPITAKWLKSLKSRVQPKQEWNEEDDKKLEWLCRIIHSCKVRKGISLAEESEIGSWVDKWLNYAPQSQWKPSDEQIKAIRLARSFVTDDFGEHNTLSEILIELEAQLKELK